MGGVWMGNYNRIFVYSYIRIFGNGFGNGFGNYIWKWHDIFLHDKKRLTIKQNYDKAILHYCQALDNIIYIILFNC